MWINGGEPHYALQQHLSEPLTTWGNGFWPARLGCIPSRWNMPPMAHPMECNRFWQPFFRWLYIYSQKAILKIISAKIMCFLRFLIARIWLKFMENCKTWFKYISKSIEGYLKIQLSYFDCCPNFAKSSSGSLPLWLQHKIGPKLLLKNTGFRCPLFKNFPFSLCKNYGSN